METNRRLFLMSAGAMALRPAATPAAATDGDLKLGLASYSMREFSRKLTIAVAKEANIRYINFKEFHLPYRATKEDLMKGRQEVEKAGLTILGGGTIQLQKDDDDDIRFHFEYAKTCGMPLMVIAPSAKTMPRIEKFVKQYDIKVAVHNHGPEDKHFPTPQSVLAVVKNMDPRVGLCIDVGHTARTGVDVIESIKEAGPRLLDMHVKDLKTFAGDKAKESQCEVGDGIMPFPAIFKTLKSMNYKGGVMLEYEINADHPQTGILRAFSYFRGVLAGMKA